jgi:hypothetical protein
MSTSREPQAGSVHGGPRPLPAIELAGTRALGASVC